MPVDPNDEPTLDAHAVTASAMRLATNASSECRVGGTVRYADGSAAAAVGVVVLARRLRREDVPLGMAVTAADGSYVVSFRTALARTDVIVRATHGTDTASSAVLVGVGPDEHVDLVLGGALTGPSDFTRAQQATEAVVVEESGTPSIADYTEQEVALLAAKTAVDPTELVLLRQSAALAEKTGLSSALFYALGRQRISLSLAGVASTAPERRRTALEAAFAANHVPSAMRSQLTEELAKLDQLAIREALRAPVASAESTLGSLLGVAGVPADKHMSLVALHIKAGGDPTTFWKSVRDGGLLAAEDVARVQNTLRVAAVALGHVPLVQALKTEGFAAPADLARLEATDWDRLVATAGIPPDLADASVTAKDYSAKLAAAVEDLVPTARLAARAMHVDGSGALAQFLRQNPEYDLRTKRLAALLRSKPDALAFLTNDAARNELAARVKGIERIYRIAPDGARQLVIETLLADRVASAHQIRLMGRAAFLRRYAAGLGLEVATRLWARATQASAVATALVTKHGAAFDSEHIAVLPSPVAALQQLPDYASLFGSADSCACAECQSLYSPAAYLCDVLNWLAGRAGANGRTALDVLLDAQRRPDIAMIELSCPNTNTTLPQIDLAIEQLELAVPPPAAVTAYQTRGAADDLRVQPEHQLAAAYTVLAGADTTKDAVYPFHLPYNLWLDEARAYAGELGVTRAAVMESLHDGGRDVALADPVVAAELFGMAPLEWDIIAGKPLSPARAPEAFWGADGDTSWVTTLSKVSTFVARSLPEASRDAGYALLTEWLRTDFVQAAGDLGIWFDGASCDTTRATIVGLTATHLDRIHRLARLQRHTAWSVADLDRAITVLGGGVLDEPLLVKLAVVRRLTSALPGLALAELLTWWGPLDTRRWAGRLRPGRPATIPAAAEGTGLVFSRTLAPIAEDGADQSFYDARFLSRSAGATPAGELRVASDGHALVDESLPLAEHAAAVAAALGITSVELDALAAGLPTDRLSLANLSQLFRYVSLARALSLRVSDLVALLSLTGVVPFDASAPAKTLALITEAIIARAARLSVAELLYLLRDVDTSPPSLAPSDTSSGIVLLALRDALRRVAADQPNPVGRRQRARAIVIDKLAASLSIEPGTLAPLLDVHVRSPLDGATAALDVFLDPALVAYAGTDPQTGAPAVPARADLPAAFATYTRLFKAALLIKRLAITKDELTWVFHISPATGGLDINTVPATPAAPPAPYAGWQRLRDAIASRNAVPTRQLLDLFERAATAQASGDATAIAAAQMSLLEELTTRTSWPRADLEFLIGVPAHGSEPARPSALGIAYPADWTDARGFVRVVEAMTTVTRIGLAAETIWAWRQIPAAIDLQQAQAAQIRQAVRARHDDASWRTIALPVRDGLRERQRDALVGWLCAHDARFASADDLYAHLLIDVQVSPCQLTSRIRQAMSSVQQLVQRALLNLEPSIALTQEDASEWAWMKTYRMWEANRKVFLYPENWIDPSLRDDKTPLFKALEATLAQREVTSDAAEAAFVEYLNSLDEQARLEIAGVLHQTDAGTDVLHVFGRTRNTPRRHYYRRRIGGVHWTPWETVEVDIAGDHLVPVVFQGRLYIFWAEITDASVEAVAPTPRGGGDTTAAAPERYYQIRIAWSQYRNGTWLGRKLSTAQIGATEADYRRNPFGLAKTKDSTPADFFFRTLEDVNGDLLIEPIRWQRNPRDHRTDPSFAWFHLDRFRLSGCDGAMVLEPVLGQPMMAIRIPPGTRIAYQRFDSLGPGSPLVVTTQNPNTSAYESEVALHQTDGPFRIVPTAVDSFSSQDVFFIEDRRRAFHVTPHGHGRIHIPPRWMNVDAISIEPMRTFADVGRPLVRRPDPWLLDARTVPRSAALAPSVAPSPLLPVAGSSVTGLLADGTNALADTLGPKVAFIGGQTMTARSPAIGVLGQTEIVSSKGEVVLSLRTSSAPAAAGELRAFTLDQRFTLPPLAVNDLVNGTVLTAWNAVTFRFETFAHPYVCRMLRQVQEVGVKGILDPSPTGPEPLLRRQQLRDPYFAGTYAPTAVETPFPIDDIAFSYGGAYAAYNWEVFFHIPFAIACWLSTNQRFEEAQRWFHYIFDPTESSRDLPAPQRFWKLRPFFELFEGQSADAGPIADLLVLLDDSSSDPVKQARRDELLAQIDAWRKQPFTPDAIARLRIVAYAKAVVMKYVDNLTAWGDMLFAQDRLETVNEATQLYVLAAQILGPRPADIPSTPPAPRTFNDLRTAGLDAFGDALVKDVENYLPDVGDPSDDGSDGGALPSLGPTLYFRVPKNDKLLADTWDRVADRLFKLRHCLDISGKPQQLALFEPPIDPGLLVQASAAGIDLASALRDVTAAQPIHRYAVLIQKANELCGDVRALGQLMLAALEKQDSEALALLRAGHEVKLFSTMRAARQQQRDEAQRTLEALRGARAAADVRVQYYSSREYMNATEKVASALLVAAAYLDTAAVVSLLVGSVVSATPDAEAGAAGFGGSPVSTLTFGGTQAHNSNQATAQQLQTAAHLSDRAASVASMIASYQRRKEEWDFQAQLAATDRDALDKQLLAAELRVAIAEHELATLDLQLSQAREISEQLRSKYTSQQLYSWMVGQLSSLYFQGYQLAYEVAKRAERAWQFELASPDVSFIEFGYWDSLKKGLLAGERLAHDLRRMEVAYLDQNRREYELTSHVSLRLLDPVALEKLRTDGECFVTIPEYWYDLDTPGHYLRRIKSVAISLPCVTGPYVPVRCTLTLLSSSVRTSTDAGGGYSRTGASDPRFRDDALGAQAIVTSGAQDDAGLFETSIHDDRYLPFERAGAISQWRIELPRQFRQFDYDTITDVVLHVRYTARDGGEPLRAAAETALLPMLQSLAQAISLREEMSDLLYQFLHPEQDATDQQMTLPLDKDRFPFMLQGNAIGIRGIDLFLAVADVTGYAAGDPVRLEVTPPGGATQAITLTSGPDFGGVPHGGQAFTQPAQVGAWTVAFREASNAGAAGSVVVSANGHRRLDPAAVRDLVIVIRYQAS